MGTFEEPTELRSTSTLRCLKNNLVHVGVADDIIQNLTEGLRWTTTIEPEKSSVFYASFVIKDLLAAIEILTSTEKQLSIWKLALDYLFRLREEKRERKEMPNDSPCKCVEF